MKRSADDSHTDRSGTNLIRVTSGPDPHGDLRPPRVDDPDGLLSSTNRQNPTPGNQRESQFSAHVHTRSDPLTKKNRRRYCEFDFDAKFKPTQRHRCCPHGRHSPLVSGRDTRYRKTNAYHIEPGQKGPVDPFYH